MRAAGIATVLLLAAGPAMARAPAWLLGLVDVPLPAQQVQVDAVQLLSDVELKVTAENKLRKRVRVAYRILRPAGEARGVLDVTYDSWTRVKDMRAWTIPESGKDYEAGLKEAADTSLVGTAGSEMISDIRNKVLRAPAVRPGAVVGFEYEIELSPLELADTFNLQDTVPVLEARYSLQVPAGWTVSANWVNHAAVDPARPDARNWQWTLRNLPAMESEPLMPTWRGVAGHLQVAFAPPGTTPELASWQGIGAWYARLARERFATSPAIRAKVAELVQGKTAPLEKLRALAAFVQSDIRYVAIELGIGGFQPHAATEVFANRFGDCKDKVTLLGAMLTEAGISSMPVLVNIERSAIGPGTPPGLLFNHVILAVQLPRGALEPELLSVADEAGGTALLFFDPTDEVTPVGRLAGALQGSWGLLVVHEGSTLLRLPSVPYAQSGVRRTGSLKLSEQGALSGSFVERLSGDQASMQRYALRLARAETELIKPVEMKLADSLAAFRIVSAEAANRAVLTEPLEWRYSMVADAYARRTGDLLTVRPRVVGVKTENIPEGEKPRVHDMVFPEARMDQDEFDIELPAGYVVESLPEPVNLDIGFAAYRSRTELDGARLKYTRTYELREMQVPAAQVVEYRRLNLAIARDERAVAVLKRSAVK